jgi:hypothetical protein
MPSKLSGGLKAANLIAAYDPNGRPCGVFQRTFKLSYGKADFTFTRKRRRHELVLQFMRLVGNGLRRKI